MKKKEHIRLKMNTKALKKAMIASTLTLMLVGSTLPSIAYAVETEKTRDSYLETAELEGEKRPIPTEGIPVISKEEIEPAVPESEMPTEEEVPVGPSENGEVVPEEVPSRQTVTPRDADDEEITEVSTEEELNNAFINGMTHIKLLTFITASTTLNITRDAKIDLNGNLLNMGNNRMNVSANNLKIENGRLNGIYMYGTIYQKSGSSLSTITMKDITFSGRYLNYSAKSHIPNVNYVFEGENDIRTSIGMGTINNLLIKGNADLQMTGGVEFYSNAQSGNFVVESNASVNLDLGVYNIYANTSLTIEENASFIAKGKSYVFSSVPNNTRSSLSINAKKGSIFNISNSFETKSYPIFYMRNIIFNFDNLNYLNIGGGTQAPIFISTTTGNINILDSQVNMWTVTDASTNGKPTNSWDILGRLEIANFTATGGQIFSNNPLVEKEFGLLSKYKRMSNGSITAKPVFEGVQSKVTIPVGTDFNPLNGITATDKIDGDLTSKIEYTFADGKVIDISKPGNYTINYTVKNSNNNVAKATTELVIEEQKMAQTTISELDTTSTSVAGLGEPNGLIEIQANQQVIATGTVGSDGKYDLAISNQAAGVTVTVSVKLNSQTSEASTVVKNGELAPTTISEINSSTTYVSGTGEPNGEIELVGNGTKLASGQVGSDGKYSFTIPKQAVGVTVIAKVTLNGKESQTSTIVAKGPAELVAPVIHDYYTTNVNVKGTIGGSAKQVAIYVNGVKKRTAAVVNGNYTLYTGDLGLTVAGQSFQIAGLLDGVEGPKTTKIVEARNQLIAPTINDYYTTDANVSGTITGSAKQVAIFVNGVQKRTAAVMNGKYVIYTGDLGLNTAGKVFQVAGIDGIMVGPKTEATVKNKEQLLAPIIHDYYTTNVNASGTIGGSAKQVAIFVNGVQKRTAAVNNGKYVIYTSDLGLTIAGQKFQIAGINGSTIGPKTEMIVKQKIQIVAPKIHDYYTTDVTASGTIGGQAEKVAVFVNGVQYRTTTVINGEYTIYTGDLGLTTAGKSFEIAGVLGSTIGPKTKMVVKQKTQLAAPQVDKYYTTDVYASGTISGEAEKVAVFVNGVQRRTTTVSNGEFTIYTGDLGLTIVGKTFEIAGVKGSVMGTKATIAVLAKP